MRVGVVTPGKLASAAIPLADAREVIHYYNDYFGVPYPLPKLDLIAVAGRLSWRDGELGRHRLQRIGPAGRPGDAARHRSGRATGVIAHEIAHQWFGNLVTMAWWDNLWLNEGFASWMASKATDHFHPEWRPYLDGIAEREYVLNLDSRKTTHPIQTRIDNEAQAANAFDAITYQKGQGFLRMLEAYLGEDAFRKGIRAYMTRHAYSNTTSPTCGWPSKTPRPSRSRRWPPTGRPSPASRSSTSIRGATAAGVASSFASCRFASPTTARARAARASGAGTSPAQLGSVGAGAGDYLLLGEASATVDRDDDCAAPLVVDADNVGFFRVRYAAPLFDALAARWRNLADGTRLKLLADTSALVRADQAPLSRWLALVERIDDEPRLAVWDQLIADVERFDQLSVGEPARLGLHRFAVAVLAPRFARLGWDERAGEPDEARQLRARLAATLSRYGDAATIAEGQRRFARWVAEPASLAPSLVDAVVEIAGRDADVATYETLLALARRAPTTEERFRAYRALATARDPALAARTVQLALDRDVPQIVRHELLAAVARSDHRELAWAYAREHADALLADMRLYDGGPAFAAIVSTSASPATADELEAFAQARLPADALVEVRRGEDEIRTRAALKSRLWPELAATVAGR